MTASCYPTTATPYHGEVAWPYWQTLVSVAERVGITGGLIDQGLFSGQGDQNKRTISVDQYMALMRCGLEHCADFGLRVGTSVTPGSYPVLGMTLLSCHSLRQVMEQVVRYESLNHDLGCSRLEPGRAESLYIWTPNHFYLPDPRSALCFNMVVSVFAGIRTFSPWLIGRIIPFRRIEFMAPPAKEYAIYKAFFSADILFNQPRNAIAVNNEVLNWPVLNGDVASFDALTSHAETLLHARNSQQDIVWQLKSILPDALRRQAVQIEVLAGQLNMSVRTLQRKLKASGTGFRPLVDEVRKRLAEFYLAEDRLPMSEIAFLIGYQEQSSFNHAFRGWSGLSPSEYRDKRKIKQ